MDSDSDFTDSDFEEDSLLDYDYIFVDILGFKTYRNRFICKEFCLIDNEYIFHTSVKSPYIFDKMPHHYKKQAYWLTNSYHGLSYDCGETSTIEVLEKVYKRFEDRKVAVKSAEKINLLQYMFRNCCIIDCVNFIDLDFIDWKVDFLPKKTCNFHDEKYLVHPECALKNTIWMQNVALENKSKREKRNRNK